MKKQDIMEQMLQNKNHVFRRIGNAYEAPNYFTVEEFLDGGYIMVREVAIDWQAVTSDDDDETTWTLKNQHELCKIKTRHVNDYGGYSSPQVWLAERKTEQAKRRAEIQSEKEKEAVRRDRHERLVNALSDFLAINWKDEEKHSYRYWAKVDITLDLDSTSVERLISILDHANVWS